MKRKLLSILCMALLLVGFVLPLYGCVPRDRTIRILSWSEYIDEGDKEEGRKALIKDFEAEWYETHGEKIKVSYETVTTNEDMYRRIKTNRKDFDLICPSDYMIEKMLADDLLLPLDFNNIPNADRDGGTSKISPYVYELMDEANPDLYKYAVGYMWGTMGILYNPALTDGAVPTWNTLFDASNKSLEGKIAMKDNVRDTYMAAGFYLGIDINHPTQQNLTAVENALKAQKPYIRGYESDEGKGWMLSKTNTLAMCLQWAGDAFWVIEEAQTKDLTLAYTVPESGGNKFFDAFVVPKYAQNQVMAEAFLDYLCRGEVAIRNMDFIGYTTCVADQEVFDHFTAIGAEAGYAPTDVSYFFTTIEGATAAKLSPIQYPTKTVMDKCTLMRNLADDTYEFLNNMWTRLRSA